MPGEIVWATFGNFLENRHADRKMRPAVILGAGIGQHYIAGLTTQPRFATTGEARAVAPIPVVCGMRGDSYLWGSRPTRLCRLDVRLHAGWADDALIDAIATHMLVPRFVIDHMRATVAEFAVCVG